MVVVVILNNNYNDNYWNRAALLPITLIKIWEYIETLIKKLSGL